MKYYIEFWKTNRAGSEISHWDIIEFDFRRDISKEAIIKQIGPRHDYKLQVTNIVKL